MAEGERPAGSLTRPGRQFPFISRRWAFIRSIRRIRPISIPLAWNADGTRKPFSGDGSVPSGFVRVHVMMRADRPAAGESHREGGADPSVPLGCSG
jgi:hypothetical protein